MWWTAFLLSVSIIMTGCSGDKAEQLPYYNTPDFTPFFITDKKEAAEKINHAIAGFSFTNQYGKPVTQSEIEGKIHVADFFFTSCGSICPVMTKSMKKVQDAFAADSDIVLLSYTVTPWIDSVARLKQYAENTGVIPGKWHLLTGSKAQIYELARKSYFAEEDIGYNKDSTDFLHTEHFILVDKQKRIRGIYNGTLELEIRQLIADIKTLKKE